jgi:hypothetical protein
MYTDIALAAAKDAGHIAASMLRLVGHNALSGAESCARIRVMSDDGRDCEHAASVIAAEPATQVFKVRMGI